MALGGISGHLPIFHSPHPGPTVPVEKSAFSLALPHELLFRFSLCHGVQHFCQDVYLPSWTVRVPSAQSSRDTGQTRRPPHLTTSYHTAQRPGLRASGLLGSGDSPADGTLTGVGVPRSQAVWASTSQQTARLGERWRRAPATASLSMEWDRNHGRALSRC